MRLATATACAGQLDWPVRCRNVVHSDGSGTRCKALSCSGDAERDDEDSGESKCICKRMQWMAAVRLYTRRNFGKPAVRRFVSDTSLCSAERFQTVSLRWGQLQARHILQLDVASTAQHHKPYILRSVRSLSVILQFPVPTNRCPTSDNNDWPITVPRSDHRVCRDRAEQPIRRSRYKCRTAPQPMSVRHCTSTWKTRPRKTWCR